MKNYLIVPLMALTLILGSCSSMPGAQEPTDAEINAQAAKAYAQILAKSKVSTNQDWNAVVQRVAHRIEIASGEHFQWHAVLLQNPEINAWCMPGGKIAVYTGIMPVLKDEAALAAVLGHEVAHAVLRHGRKQYARAVKENMLGLIVAGAAIAGGELLCKTSTCKLLTGLGGAGAGFGITFFERKFSRADETQADRYGQIYMARAGYDPAEAVKLWQRMTAAMGNSAPPEWLSTHPSDARRQGNLRAWLPEVEAIYQKAPVKYGLGEAIR